MTLCIIKSLIYACLLQSSANLGMAMIYTLVASIKDWLIEKFEETDGAGGSKENDTTKEDVCLSVHR